ncbi:MAG TPA: hypothetical protein VHE61_10460 [Opitutaceae bacterium]|nr:hypothetical protein [Opitutaceae bacterium]
MSFTDLLQLKAACARIHDIVTVRLALALVTKLERRCGFSATAAEKMRKAINDLHPNAAGFDLDSADPNMIAEVKGNIPMNGGIFFGAAQVKGLTNDVLQMLGRPPAGKSQNQLSPRAKILRPKLADALKFVGLYDSPKVRAAVERWKNGLIRSKSWISTVAGIEELPETGHLSPDVVYLVYLAPEPLLPIVDLVAT